MTFTIQNLTSYRSLKFFLTLCVCSSMPLLVEAAYFTVEQFTAKDLPIQYGTYSGTGIVSVVRVNGTEAGKMYSIAQKRISGAKPEDSALIEDNEPRKIVVTDEGYIPGEPIEFFIKEIGKIGKKSVKVVPLPIVSKSSQDQAQVEAVVAAFQPPTYMISFKGFRSDEDLDFKSKSYDEVLKKKLNTRGTMVMLPAVLGKKGGIAEVTFQRKSGEVFKIELPWGFEWMKYRAFYDDKGEKKMYLDDPEFRKQNPDVVKYFESKKQVRNTPR